VDDAVQDAEDSFAVVLVLLLSADCAAKARADPDQLAEARAESGFSQRRMIKDTGWMSYPDGASSALTRTLDEACVDELAPE
jgi:hypothetical protein